MDTKDILQINATLVAGAFIFLSLSITSPDDTNSSNNTTTNKTILLLTRQRLTYDLPYLILSYLIRH
jgi:hypothetical protein